jgi:hypothetical protein
MRLAKSRAVLGHSLNVLPVKVVGDCFPQGQTFGVACVVSLKRYDVLGPARGNWNPLRFLEEKGLGQDAAANREIAPVIRIGLR